MNSKIETKLTYNNSVLDKMHTPNFTNKTGLIVYQSSDEEILIATQENEIVLIIPPSGYLLD